MAFWAALLPILKAAGAAAAGSAVAGAMSKGKKAPPQPPPPPTVVKGSEKDDTVKAVLIENIKNEREAKHALASAEKALTRETTKDIAETSAAQ
jgi:hypothetical protein